MRVALLAFFEPLTLEYPLKTRCKTSKSLLHFGAFSSDADFAILLQFITMMCRRRQKETLSISNVLEILNLLHHLYERIYRLVLMNNYPAQQLGTIVW
eukprot:g68094.t1